MLMCKITENVGEKIRILCAKSWENWDTGCPYCPKILKQAVNFRPKFLKQVVNVIQKMEYPVKIFKVPLPQKWAFGMKKCG